MSRAWAAGLGIALTLACSSAPKDIHEHDQIAILRLKFRRPTYAPVDPEAHRGSPEFVSNPKPNESFDCKTSDEYFSSTPVASIRACLKSLQTAPVTLRYVLERKASPELVLETDAEQLSDCTRKFLSRIPVPREIFYEREEEKGVACYSSQLNLQADEWMGVKLPKARFALIVEFPLERIPESDGETRRTLLAWALTPFWNAETGKIRSRYVPESICAKCLGERDRFAPQPFRLPRWP